MLGIVQPNNNNNSKPISYTQPPVFRSRVGGESKTFRDQHVTVNSDSETICKEEVIMKTSFKRWLITVASLTVIAASNVVLANAGVEKLNQEPNYWAFPGGNYWNWRYTELKQINNTNA